MSISDTERECHLTDVSPVNSLRQTRCNAFIASAKIIEERKNCRNSWYFADFCQWLCQKKKCKNPNALDFKELFFWIPQLENETLVLLLRERGVERYV